MTDLYAVIGNPVLHSRSPSIHRAFAQATRQSLEYRAIEAPVDGFTAAVRAFIEAGGRGMNVTMPFKLQAFELCDELSDDARSAGAVNALKFEDGQIHGQNFDGIGLLHDIERNLGVQLAGLRVLVLGAGGAVRGALRPLLSARPSLLHVANRTPERAARLCDELPRPSQTTIRASDIGSLADSAFDVVINGTSASMTAQSAVCPASALNGVQLAYDMVYARGLTPFLRLAREQGAQRLADGVGMLVEQAAEAFTWWRGVPVRTGPVIRELTVPLI